MGQFIVKLKEHYLIWSSIVDAPISNGMNLKQLKRWIRREYGQRGIDELPARLERVEQKGTSAMGDDSAVSTIWLNRAGPEESRLMIEGIYRHYCLGESVRDEWIVRDPDDDLKDDEESTGFDLHGAIVGNWPNINKD